MSKKECIAMLLAGGQGSRLGALTQKIAKPAVSFGGKFRIIDFSLSNCSNSGIDTVGVLTQYRPYLLHAYVGSGEAWDLDSRDGGRSCRRTRRRPVAPGMRARPTPLRRTSTTSRPTTPSTS